MENQIFNLECGIKAAIDACDNLNVSLTYKDSDGRAISTNVNGDNIDSLIDGLSTEFIGNFIMQTKQLEAKQVAKQSAIASEIDELKAKIAELEAENERLEHRIQRQTKHILSEDESGKSAYERVLLADLNSLLEMFGEKVF